MSELQEAIQEHLQPQAPVNDSGMSIQEAAEMIEERMDDGEPEQVEESHYQPASIEEVEDYATGYQAEEEPGYENEKTFYESSLDELERDYNSHNWEALKNIDPEEYNAKQLEFQQKYYDLNNNLEKVKFEDNAKLERDQRNKYLKEKSLLHAAIPEWESESVMRREQAQMKAYMKKRGFSDQEINEISSDHRSMLAIRDAAVKQPEPRKKNLPPLKKKSKLTQEQIDIAEVDRKARRINAAKGSVEWAALMIEQRLG